jgi:hypothetical protein
MAKKAPRRKGRSDTALLYRPSFVRDLRSRRVVPLELPEFLIYALERRVAEANAGASADQTSTLDHYIESELVNLITVRDVAELEITAPGFGAAVQQWLDALRE